MSDDSPLLRRFATEGSQDAFEEIVRRHLGLVYGSALRQLGGDEHLARDVSQVVFVLLARGAGRLAGRASIASWLYVTTRNQAVKVVRSERRRRRREQEAQAMQQTHAESSEPDWSRLLPWLDKAIYELSPAEREAVVLRFFEGSAYATIAQTQGTTEDAARMRVTRAVERLRGRFRRLGVISSVEAIEQLLAAQGAAAVPSGLPARIAGAALTKAAAAGPSLLFGFMSATPAKSAVAACIASLLLGLFTKEYRTNQRLAAEIAGTETVVNRLRIETAAAARAPTPPEAAQPARTGMRAARSPGPVRPTAEAFSVPIPAATARATLHVTKNGSVAWNGEPVTLREFLNDLVAFRRDHPEKTAQLMVAADGALGSQVEYVFNESRKAGIQTWFDPATISPIGDTSPPPTTTPEELRARADARRRQERAAAAEAQ